MALADSSSMIYGTLIVIVSISYTGASKPELRPGIDQVADWQLILPYLFIMFKTCFTLLAEAPAPYCP
jgi:hypothetical protein